MKAIYLGRTHNRGLKDRWECPNCRSLKNPECRFNLSVKKEGKIHSCRFCKIKLKLEK